MATKTKRKAKKSTKTKPKRKTASKQVKHNYIIKWKFCPSRYDSGIAIIGWAESLYGNELQGFGYSFIDNKYDVHFLCTAEQWRGKISRFFKRHLSVVAEVHKYSDED